MIGLISLAIQQVDLGFLIKAKIHWQRGRADCGYLAYLSINQLFTNVGEQEKGALAQCLTPLRNLQEKLDKIRSIIKYLVITQRSCLI
jgi:hypothetical protein